MIGYAYEFQEQESALDSLASETAEEDRSADEVQRSFDDDNDSDDGCGK